jgi:hypothetical protein
VNRMESFSMHALHTFALKAKIDYQYNNFICNQRKKACRNNNSLSFFSKFVHTCNLPSPTQTHHTNVSWDC